MKHIPTITFLAITHLCISCTHRPQPWQATPAFRERLAPHVYVAPEPAPKQSPKRTSAPPKGIRVPERITTYHQGRTLSPDHRAMHEAHPVYRIDESGQWNLTDNPNPSPDNSLTHAPINDQEIEAEKQHQQEITKRLESMETEMNQWRTELKGLLETQRAKLASPTVTEPPLPTRNDADPAKPSA